MGSGSRRARQRARKSAADEAAPEQGGDRERSRRPAPESARRAPEAVGGRTFRPDPGRVALGNLRAAVRRRALVAEQIERGVQRARAAGCSWREVGATLGVSHVAALKRYGPGLRDGASGAAQKPGVGAVTGPEYS